jgi:multiple sugar transport system permease protein
MTGSRFFHVERRGQSTAGLGLLWISPTAFLFTLLIAWPLIEAFLLTFRSVNSLTLASRPVGLDNYREMLTDPTFWTALKTNFIWLFSCLTIETVGGVLFALLLNRQFPGRNLARALVLFPYMLPTVVAVLIWRWMFNDIYGIVNWGLVALSVRPLDWLGVMPNAFIGVIVVGSWRVMPFVVMAVLARLQTIPQQLYDAARIDGATRLGLFFDVTLPQLRAVLFGTVLLRMIWDFKEFDLIYLMTGGGPVIGTTTLPVLVYNEAFALLRMGKASAIAVTMLVIISVAIFCYYRVFGRYEKADDQ